MRKYFQMALFLVLTGSILATNVNQNKYAAEKQTVPAYTLPEQH
ncbi:MULTISPECIES: hypothetical protein [unclassified Bacillus (in: firmicutes)]|nr:hypothetical protein [Bacillus sp. BP-3]MDC2866120.1 hypothetical protein [Bacillus sp. BP-3]